MKIIFSTACRPRVLDMHTALLERETCAPSIPNGFAQSYHAFLLRDVHIRLPHNNRLVICIVPSRCNYREGVGLAHQATQVLELLGGEMQLQPCRHG